MRKENESLKSQLSLPEKNSSNSSSSPSKDFKKNKSSSIKDKRRYHSEGGRELSDNPDETKGLMILLKLKPKVILKKRFISLKENLFMFLDYDNVPPTNNSSKQALRPSVIFRKVTNGFRSLKGKDIFANFRTVVDTAKKQGQNTFQAICDIFNHKHFNYST